MIVSLDSPNMGSTKPPAATGNVKEPGPTGEVQQVVTPNAPTVNAGAGAGAWFSQQGKDLGQNLFGAVGDRVGSEIRYGGPSAVPGGPGSGGAVMMPSTSMSPLVIGGMMLGGILLVALVVRK